METLDKNILSREFKLTNNESLVFLELLRVGSLPIGKIIRLTNLHRGTVYNTIQRLIEKGLINTQKIERANTYSASHFGLLKEIYHDEKSLSEKKKIANKIMKLAELEKENNDSEGEIKVFRGVAATDGYVYDLFQKCRSNEEDFLLIGAPNDNIIKQLGMDRLKYRQLLKKKLGVSSKTIRSEEMLEKDWVKLKIGKTKFLPKEFKFHVAIQMQGNESAIMDWDKNPVEMILIENKNITKTYENMFKFLWKQKAVKVMEVKDINF